MTIDLIIFDCDGVMADSEVLSASVLIDQLAVLGIVVTAADVRRDFLGRSFPTVAQSIRQRWGRPLPDSFEADYRARLLDRFSAELRPTPGFLAVLDGLGIPACVATSSSPQRVGHTLRVLGLADRFGDRVFTASQVRHGKPAPDLFLLAAARMGCPPASTLVIEDSAPGIAAALAAEMRVLHYAGGAHLRGAEPMALPRGVRSFDNWAEFPQLLANLQQEAATR
ncbi:6-phosphogluconate phosphatase [Paracoccus haematequi]|uniref:6-phosphogluconate phosphatase n=1 Tax=Paracoccus haematequi TaxID=2491866 RepID=A0A447IT46_9RHOB|nr:HAD-IA family hydrolase [Paracoccus haematequi]VDS10688.1 6-phosphogluconate phosphatase [Paracoccus haematequi]